MCKVCHMRKLRVNVLLIHCVTLFALLIDRVGAQWHDYEMAKHHNKRPRRAAGIHRVNTASNTTLLQPKGYQKKKKDGKFSKKNSKGQEMKTKGKGKQQSILKNNKQGQEMKKKTKGSKQPVLINEKTGKGQEVKMKAKAKQRPVLKDEKNIKGQEMKMKPTVKEQQTLNNKTKKTQQRSKSPTPPSEICTCPTEPSFGAGGLQRWDATLLVDLIGVKTEMAPNQLTYYEQQLEESMVIGFNKRCPQSQISIASVKTVEQSSTSTGYPGNRVLQSRNSANRIDNKVSVSYRVPPRKPNFASLTIYSLSDSGGGGSRRYRRLEWQAESIYRISDRSQGNELGVYEASCPLDTTFLERLKADNDPYFLEVIATNVTVIESSFSYEYYVLESRALDEWWQ